MPNPVSEGLQEARRVRAKLGVDSLQAIDPGVVARRLGLQVVRRRLRAAPLSGIHMYDEELGKHLILVNSGQPALRQRFTLAHEIGHARFDRETIVEDVENLESTPQEKRANAFASELLLPEAAVKRWQPHAPWGTDIDDVARLALAFGVSLQVAAWKLHNVKLVPDARALIDRSVEVDLKLRSRLREPGDNETEYPTEYVELVKDGVARELISRGRAAELLAQDEDL
jgi:Zn-dependent peptidase ImmA (M78 family)